MSTHPQLLEELEENLGLLLRSMKQESLRKAKAVSPELQGAGFMALGYVHHHQPCRVMDIASYFGIDKGAISRHVQQLEELGLVRREKSASDNRSSLLYLTEAAEEKLAALRSTGREAWSDSLADWADVELETLNELLVKLQASLKERP